MASTNDLKNGIVLNIDGQLWSVVEFQHVKPGKGAAFVRTKLKNVAVRQDRRQDLQRRRQGRDRQRRQAQHAVPLQRRHRLRLHGHAAPTTSCRCAPRSSATPRTSCSRTRRRSSPPTTAPCSTSSCPPPSCLEITYTEPGLQGDRSTGGTKPATLETGHEIAVPLFIEQGDQDQGRHPRRLLPRPRQADPVAARTKARKRALDILFEAELRGIDPADLLRERLAGPSPSTPLTSTPPTLVTGVVDAPGPASTSCSRRTRRAGRCRGCRPWTATSCGSASTRSCTSQDVPDAVAISEAVALATELSTDESPALRQRAARPPRRGQAHPRLSAHPRGTPLPRPCAGGTLAG